MRGRQPAVDLIFRALGDPTRRAIVERLSERPIPASLLVKPLKISLPAVLQHLKVLEECGLVRSSKAGRIRTCRMEPAGFSAMEGWLHARRAAWERRFDRLGELLAEESEYGRR